MTYSEAIEYLYGLRLFGMKLGLDNSFRLAAAAGNPQNSLRFIHVAGTNGKGSTCAMMESIYRAAGYRVGLFTSPHLVSFAERIQVDRRLISHEDVARLTETIRGVIETLGAETHPTFFEAVTVMALQYFAEQKCDLVVWETGLGGRLDATNIVTPLASVITNIQLDHEKWLGHTTPEIAREKAGIIKQRVPVLTAADDLGALAVIVEAASQRQAPLTVVPELTGSWEMALAGEHQKKNAALALAVVQVLQPQISVSESAMRDGLRNTHWPGRLQTVQFGSRTILLDGAHNPAGAQTLAAALQAQFSGRRPALVLGTMGDKDYGAICHCLAPLAKKIFISPVRSERAADPPVLAAYCREAAPSTEVIVCQNIGDAVAQTAMEEFVVVTGSLHFISEAMQELGLAAGDDESALNDYSVAHLPTRCETKVFAFPLPAGEGKGEGERGEISVTPMLKQPSRATYRSPSPQPSPAGRGGNCEEICITPLLGGIRAVTFDVGGTLIEPWPSVGNVYAEMAAHHGLKVDAQVLDRQFLLAWEAKKDFGYSLSDWTNLVQATFAGLIDAPADKILFRLIYDHFATATPWKIFDDVVPCLQQLKSRGIKLGVVSNWDERLHPLLRALKLDHYFDNIVVSGELGLHKPAVEIFQRAAAELNEPPGSILHIGDSTGEDVAGARAAGLQSLLLARNAKPGGQEVASIPSLASLPRLIS